MTDNELSLRDHVRQACAQQQALAIRGSGSKMFYGNRVDGEVLQTTLHRGILEYSPTELVLTARSGTPLAEIETVLAEQGQMLACEPPYFGERATFGGMIAAGLSGPARPYQGSISDQVLGCRVINGRGEVLNFGGKVMKNVAGYDVSRLMAGSLGVLGVVLQATIRVMPRAVASVTACFDVNMDAMADTVNRLLQQDYPVTASCHDSQVLYARLSGSSEVINDITGSLQQLDGFQELMTEDEAAFWTDLREQRLAFFKTSEPLWRLSVPPAARLEPAGDYLLEWHGALRWLKTAQPAREVFDRVAAVNGSATLFRTTNPVACKTRFQPLSAPLQQWHRQLKTAFDPEGILNPGRMYSEI